MYYNDPVFSPDGRSVAFAMAADTQSNVYKIAVDGGQPVQLTFADAAHTWSPAWSPDGQRIAYISVQGAASKVWIVGADGGNARPLERTDASDTYNRLAWSPSPEIFYPTRGLHNLRRLNVETQEEKLLFPQDSKGWFLSKPVFSPDGKKFAILWNNSPEGAWPITLDTLSISFLYQDALPFGWSVDKKFLYAFYSSVEGNGREILEFRLGDSKKPKSLITMPGTINSATLSPDGRKIIVSVSEEKSDVWLFEEF
jgi:Tol biopolymer transport system component